MRSDWIQDILAVMDTGSLARAAEQRCVTQSAFTRRIRMIEDGLGAPLFDRARKPVEVLPAIRALEPELRELAGRLDNLYTALRGASRDTGATDLAFVCQHAITSTVSPRIVAALTSGGDVSVRVRSANRDECLVKLLSGEVDFALMYESPVTHRPAVPKAFERAVLDSDLLLPVCAPHLDVTTAGAVVPLVTYPADVFLGRVFAASLAPRLPAGVILTSKAETALTLAAFRYALSGIGIAWLPLSLVKDAIDRGELCRVGGGFPETALELVMIWLAEDDRPRIREIRDDLLSRLYPETLLQRPTECRAKPAEPADRANR